MKECVIAFIDVYISVMTRCMSEIVVKTEKMQCIFKGELTSFLVNVWESASFTTRANISLFVISGAIKFHFIPVEHDGTNEEDFEALISIITCVTEFIINAGRADLSFLLLKYAFLHHQLSFTWSRIL